ncbi:MAG: tetratricopeptide repeat protein [Prevotella sp.]|jgi:hypothetical protein|nr:tetratricopeptide repeat protein [Prevotella sp.]
MKSLFIYLFFSVCCLPAIFSQTLAEAKDLYLQGKYKEASPVFETELKAKPEDASLNMWYGACLFETGGDQAKAEECLLKASKKRVQDSFFYLGQLYALQYRFNESADAFTKYEAMLKKKDDGAKAKLEEKRKTMSRLRRVVSNTEDVQIIDSLIIDKSKFLSAYKLSLSSGRLDYFDNAFISDKTIDATVYTNEKGMKMYYAKPDKNNVLGLYAKEKLLHEFGDEKKLSPQNFGLSGDLNYPFVMTDGVTIYFAAKDEESLGGYDLFVSRYNMNNDTYLAPERLNMPFNSRGNDYMMAVDEEKGVGWFATDRNMPEGKVCVYTFIPNKTVKIIDSGDEAYVANRARVTSIKSSWETGKNYSDLIASARKEPVVKAVVAHDFEFVINDDKTYYKMSDFMDRTAGETFSKARQAKAEYKDLSDLLEKRRGEYAAAAADEKRRMSSDIFDMEKRQEQLQAEIPLLETQARNLEIQAR